MACESYPVPKLKTLSYQNLPHSGSEHVYRHVVEQNIKHSRFIASVGRIENRPRAKLFVDWIKSLYPDATHNCWAYNAGPPGESAAIGQSDDGEPHGTAGKPILNQILHYPGGETIVVVTRYFGGIKLGGGGLVRAYQSSAAMALQNLPLGQLVSKLKARIAAQFSISGKIPGILAAHGAEVVAERYLDKAYFDIEISESGYPGLEASLLQAGLTVEHISFPAK